MPNGKDKTQTSGDNLLGGLIEPRVQEQDNPINPDVSVAQDISNSIEQYRGWNPYYVRNQLLKNDGTFKDASFKMFAYSLGKENFQALRSKPDVLKRSLSEYRKNLRKYFDKKTHVGEPLKDTLVKRSVGATTSPEDMPISEYVKTIKNNKKKYDDFGLFYDDGTFMYDNDTQALKQYISQDKKLHQIIEEDRYNQFMSELSEDHNEPDFINTPAETIVAWTVYDKLGSEGLTKYINAYQDNEGEGLIEREMQREKVSEFFKNAGINGKKIKEIYEDYVYGTSKDVKYGNLISKYAYQYELSPVRLAAQIDQESNFNPNAVSVDGAVGLMQFTEGAWKDYGNGDRTDPEANLKAGARYMSDLLQRFDGNYQMALAGYVGGPSDVTEAIQKAAENGGTWLDHIDDRDEVVNYINKVTENIDKYRDSFTGGVVVKPLKQRKGTELNIPKDGNNYTFKWYAKNGRPKEITKIIKSYVQEVFPEGWKQAFNIKNLASGEFSDEFQQLTKSIYKSAKENKGFNLMDLWSTVVVGSELQREKIVDTKVNEDIIWRSDVENETVFRTIDYNNLNFYQKAAFNALMNDRSFNFLFENKGNGIYKFQPNRFDVTSIRRTKQLRHFLDTTQIYTKDEDGNTIVKTIPEKGLFATPWNAVVSTVISAKNEGLRFLSDVAKGIFDNLIEAVPEGLAAQKISDNETIGELLNRKQAQLESFSEEMGTFSTARVFGEGENEDIISIAGTVGTFLPYIAGIYGMGKAALRGGVKAFEFFTGVREAGNIMKLGQVLKGSKRMRAMALKLGRGLESRSPWVMDSAPWYLGSAAFDAISPEQYSLYNVVPQLTGVSKDNPFTQFYMHSNNITQALLDAGTSLFLDIAIDGILATGKFGVAKAGQVTGMKKLFKGIRFTDGAFEGTTSPAFRHEAYIFSKNLTEGLADKPMGEIGETMAKNFFGGDNPSTTMDFVKMVSDQTGDYMENIKKDIRSSLEKINDELEHGNVPRARIDREVERNYNTFLNSIADGLVPMLKSSGDENLPLRVAQALEQQLPISKEFKVAGETIRPSDAPSYISQGHKLIVKGDKVFEVQSKLWTADLAKKIRLKALRQLDSDKDRIAREKIISKGIDPESYDNSTQAQTAERIRTQVDEFLGLPVSVNNKLGYIVDFDDQAFIVRTATGDVRMNKVTELPDMAEHIDLIQEVKNKIDDFRQPENPTTGTILLDQLDVGTNVDDIAQNYTFDNNTGVVLLDNQIYRLDDGFKSFNFENGKPVSMDLFDVAGRQINFDNPQIVQDLYSLRAAGHDFDNPVKRIVNASLIDDINSDYAQVLARKVQQNAELIQDVRKHEFKIPYC